MLTLPQHREAIGRGARVLNQLGQAMGSELDAQNKHLGRVDRKVDENDMQIERNRIKLKAISDRG
jgi:hypothetical protein